MPIFHVPYRWRPSTIHKNLRSMYLDVVVGVGNVFRWLPIVWHDRDYDWTYLTRAMEWKLRRMAKYARSHGHLLDSPKQAKQMEICANLLKRLNEEDFYYDNADKIYGKNRDKYWSKSIGDHQVADRKYCFYLIGKHLGTWWD